MPIADLPFAHLGFSARVRYDGHVVVGVDIKRALLSLDAPSWLEQAMDDLLDGGSGPSYRLEGLTVFQEAVMKATRAIPFGEVRSYQEIAASVQRPRAMRAVGGAMAICPLPLVIPCHRVVRADGRISQNPQSHDIHRRLLHHEGSLEGTDHWRRMTTS